MLSLLSVYAWESIYFYYPYPDYKLPCVIYSDDMPCGNFMPAPVDYNQARLESFDEYKALASFSQAEDRRMFANSFLVEAAKKI